MEFVDVILIVLYVVLGVAIVTAIASYVLRRCRASGRGRVQNGVHVQRLNLCVWLTIVLLIAIALVCVHGDIVSTILITLVTLLIATIIVVLWAVTRAYLHRQR